MPPSRTQILIVDSIRRSLGNYFFPNRIILACALVAVLLSPDIVEARYRFLTKWGSAGSNAGQFKSPQGLALDGAGNVYVADQDNGRIQKFDSDGNFIAAFGSTGTADGQFQLPQGIAFWSGANVLFVADFGNHRIQRISAVNGAYITKVGGYGTATGKFNNPVGVAVDGSGNVYVCDSGNGRIQKFDEFLSYISQFSVPSCQGVALYSDGNILVVAPPSVRKYSSGGTLLLEWGTSGIGDGQFTNPRGVAVGPDNTVYVADRNNDRVQRFDSSGVFLGKFGTNGSGDGQFNGLPWVALDASGNLFATDGQGRIQKIFEPLANFLFTTLDSSGDRGAGASLAIDRSTNVHVSYYDLTNGNLVYAKITDPATPIWGVQVVAPAAAANAPGAGTSIALGPDGNPRIAFVNGQEVAYAEWTGTSWATATITNRGTLNALRPSLAVDAAGMPHVAFRNSNGEVYHAAKQGSAWSLSFIENILTSGYDAAIALDHAGIPHVVYTAGGSSIKHARFSGGGWTMATVDNVPGDSLSLAINGAGFLRAVYRDANNNKPKHAQWNGNSWTAASLEAGPFGTATSIAMDGEGDAHILYRDLSSMSDQVKYARQMGNGWKITQLSGSGSMDKFTSIALDAGGNVHAAFYDSGNADLRYGRWNGAGFWPPLGNTGRGTVGAPTGFSATAVHQTSAAWAWTNNASHPSGYKLYGNSSGQAPFSLLVDSLAGSASQVTETGLSPGSTYYRYILAVNSAGAAVSQIFKVVTSSPPALPLPTGCGLGLNVKTDGSQSFTSIQAAVNAIGASLSTTTCVIIRDAATYNEQVTVAGINTNGHRVKIMADPSLNTLPTVVPPNGSIASFQINNTSVTIARVAIQPSSSLNYGIYTSSSDVSISSVDIRSQGYITGAGVRLTTHSLMEYSMVDASVYAQGVLIEGSWNAVTHSTITNNGVRETVHIASGSNNLVKTSYLFNGWGNVLSLYRSHMNSVENSAIHNGGLAYISLYLNGSSSNSIRDSVITNAGTNGGYALLFQGPAHYNRVDRSTFSGGLWTVDTWDPVVGLDISESRLGKSIFLYSSLSRLRRIMVEGGGQLGFFSMSGSTNSIEDSTWHNARAQFYGTNIALDRSTFTNEAANPQNSSELWVQVSSASVRDCHVMNADGQGLFLQQASMVAVKNTHIQGSTAVYYFSGQDISFQSSVLISTQNRGFGLQAGPYASGITLSLSTVSAGAQGKGIVLDSGHSGAVSFSSVTIRGAGMGLALEPNYAAYSISSLNFSGLPPGATAIQFGAGWFNGSLYRARFDDSAVNVDARLLTAGSRVAMLDPQGARSGSAFENDPNDFVDWGETVGLGESLDNTSLSWTTSGDGLWYGKPISAAFGGDAAQSGPITHGKASNLQANILGPGTLTFQWKVSSEQNYDYLSFFLDAARQDRISGEAAWQERTYTIPVGEHVLRWEYGKDASVAQGSDAGWVDKVQWSTSAVVELPTGCGAGANVRKDGSGQHTSIQAAVDALSKTLSTTTCIVIRDAGTYDEQVKIEGFTNNGFRLKILSDSANAKPIISPPALSTAAFLVKNASVTVQGFTIRHTNPVPYGVRVSSDYAAVAVLAIEGSNKIYEAGIVLGANATVTDSSVTVQDAHGLWATGSKNTIERSTIASASLDRYALYLDGSSSNTVSRAHVVNTAGAGAALYYGAHFNTITLSTIASYSDMNVGMVLWQASSNIISGSFLYSKNWIALSIFREANFNSVTNANLVSASNSSTNGSALEIQSSSNTISESFISRLDGNAGSVVSISENGAAKGNSNVIDRSTIAGHGAALSISGSSNTVTRSYLESLDSIGIWLTGSSRNSVSFSTVIARYDALVIRSASNTVSSCYARGSSGADISGATGTLIASSILQSTDPSGDGVVFRRGGVNLTLSSNTVIAGGTGISLSQGNGGTIALSSNAVLGAARGLSIDPQAAGAALTVSEMRFQALASGATAVHFTGGVAVSTFTNMRFVDDSASVNVNGSLLIDGSRITMRDASGPRAGPVYENDPDGRVDWAESSGLGEAVDNTSLSWTTSGDGLWFGQTSTSVFGGDSARSGAIAHDKASTLQASALGPGTLGFQWKVSSEQNYDFLSFRIDGILQDRISGEVGWQQRSYSIPAGPHALVWEYRKDVIEARGSDAAWVDKVEWTPGGASGLPQGCGSGLNVKKDGTENHVSIQAAVDSLLKSLSGDVCVVIRDTGTYTESVAVTGFTNNGYRIKIMADPSFISSAPVISPPAFSTAAFLIQNASVTLHNLTIRPTNAVAFGVKSTAQNTVLEKVQISDSAGRIWDSAAYLKEQAVVNGSTIMVSAANGLALGGGGNVVSFSNIWSSGAWKYGITSNYYPPIAHSNLITQCVIHSDGGLGGISFYGDGNLISLSTITGVGDSLVSLGGSQNTISDSYLESPVGGYVWLSGDNAVLVRSSIAVRGEYAVRLRGIGGQLSYNKIINNARHGIELFEVSSATLRANIVWTGSDANWVPHGIELISSSFNVIAGNHISSPRGNGIFLNQSDLNSVIQSTATGFFSGIMIWNSSSNTVNESYLQGRYGVEIDGSTGTRIESSVLVSTDASQGLYASDAINISLFHSTVVASDAWSGIHLGRRVRGQIDLVGGQVRGARIGVYLQSPNDQISLSIASMSFAGSLAAGTTAIYIGGQLDNDFPTGSVLIATFSRVDFSDTAIGVNMYANSRLGGGTRITMRDAAGARAGPAYENDPNSHVDWVESNGLGDAMDSTALSWATSGDALWYGQSSTSAVGGDSARSGSIAHGQASKLQASVVGPGTLSFRWKVSSEQGYDFLSFFMDNLRQDRISGEVGWEQRSYTIPTGEHALLWEYKKDDSVTQGSDAAWVDQVQWTVTASTDLSAGCGVGLNVKKDGTRQHVSIQSAIDALAKNLTDSTCIIIRDSETYNEQITLEGFSNNGHRLSIAADPSFTSSRPVISPPASSYAAFVVKNASVTLTNITIRPTSGLSYGIRVSSEVALMAGIVIDDSAGQIAVAGMAISSWSTVANSSVTAPAAHGLWVTGRGNSIARSTFTTNTGTKYSLSLDASAANALSRLSIRNDGGTGLYLSTGAHLNEISLSTITGGNSGYALKVVGASSNTFTQTYAYNPGNTAAIFNQASSANVVVQSTIISQVPVIAFHLMGSYNSIRDSRIKNPSGVGLVMDGPATRNLVSRCMIEGGMGFLNADGNDIDGSSIAGSVYFHGASSNSISRSYVFSPLGVMEFHNSRFNTISQSTIAGNNENWLYSTVYLEDSEYNVFDRDLISNTTGYAIMLRDGAQNNTISNSSVTSLGCSQDGCALALVRASSNTILNTYIESSGGGSAGTLYEDADYNNILHSTISGRGVALMVNSRNNTINGSLVKSFYESEGGGYVLWIFGNYNSVNLSTITSAGSDGLLEIQGSGNGVNNSYLAGKGTWQGVGLRGGGNAITHTTITASGSGVSIGGASNALSNSTVMGDPPITVYGATGTVIGSSILIATGASGGISCNRSENLDVSSTIIRERAGLGSGIQLGGQNTGAVRLVGNTITGFSYGVEVNEPTTALDLIIDSMTFAGPSSDWRVAILLLGGRLNADFYNIDFADPKLQRNVFAENLASGSNIMMWGARGPRAGSLYEYDPAGVVEWAIAPGAPGTPIGSALGTSSIAWTWSSATNASGYLIYQATSPATIVGSRNSTGLILTGLSTNTAYGVVVQAVSAGGVSSLSPAATVYTAAAVPGALVSTGISSITASVEWSVNGNPLATTYEMQWSTSVSFLPVISTTFAVVSVVSPSSPDEATVQEGAAATISNTVTGLLPATNYFFRVRAHNGDGVPTAFSSVLNRQTLPPPPGRPQIASGTALGISSISWTWSAVEYAASYSIHLGSNPFVLFTAAATPAVVQTGLLPNTSSSILVSASNISGTGPFSSTATAVYTLANPPSGSVASAVYATSATLSWGLNGNPTRTAAELELSTDNASFSGKFAGQAASYTIFDLLGCTSYYFRVRNRNGGGIATSYDSSMQFRTDGSTPNSPSTLQADSMAGNRIMLAWAPSPAEGISQYNLYYDGGTGKMNYADTLAILSSTTRSYTTGVLASSAAYRFGLRAVNRCGVEEKNTFVVASAPSLNSLSGVRAAIKVPQSGKRVSGNRVTVIAEILLGDEAQTRRVLFQYKASTASAWSDIVAANVNHSNPDSDAPYLVHWNVTALSSGSYDLRAVATDIQGSADAAPAAVSILVDPADPDITENSQAGGKVKKEQKVHNTVDSTLQAGDESSKQVTKVEIPAGAVEASTVTVAVTNNPVLIPPPPASVQDIGVVTEIVLSNGQSQLATGKTASVVLSYPDENGDGIVDGTGARTDRLQMYSAETVAGPWKKDLSTSVDASKKTVTGITSHFSFFALFAPAAADLSALRVYPIPFMPNNSDADDGVPYASGNANSGIIFDNLPASVSIKIYTVTGRLVAQVASDSTSGKLQWDVKNSDGKDVASGGYLAVITSPGQGKIVKKILIVR